MSHSLFRESCPTCGHTFTQRVSANAGLSEKAKYDTFSDYTGRSTDAQIFQRFIEAGSITMNRQDSFAIALAASALFALSGAASGKETAPVLKIVQDHLLESGNFYFVNGSVYNPNASGVRNVVIRYFIWKKWMGQDGHGSTIKETGGLVVAKIKYLPPKQTIEFTATGGDNAPVMTLESGLMPDPINAEITAEWDR